jgi:tetratricopeptide (TPR) repeat protein
MRSPFLNSVAAVVLLSTTLLTGGLAHSEATPTGADASQNADDLFRAGKVAYKAGKLQEAYEAYRAAWRLKRTYDIAANLANAESQLGKTRDAAEHLAFCIRNFPPTGGKAQLDHIKAQFDEARREVLPFDFPTMELRAVA